MAKHAEAMFEESQSEDCRPDVLNVGFGLGLVDTALQKLNPKSHTIVCYPLLLPSPFTSQSPSSLCNHGRSRRTLKYTRRW